MLRLPPDLFEQITGCCDDSAGPRQDKRKAARVPFALRAIIVHAGGPKPVPPASVKVRDISATGIALLCPVAIPAGRTVVVVLPTRDAKKMVKLECRVVRCTSADGRQYLVAASYVRVCQSSAASPPPAKADPREAEADRIRKAMFA